MRKETSVLRWEYETANDGLMLRVLPEHRPLRAWTREAVQQITEQAFAALADMDQTWRAGKVLRAAHLDSEGKVHAGPLGAVSDDTFAEVYRIVAARSHYGYANILAKMLSVEPQSVRNKVRELRKAGLIEPATSRGNT